MAPSLTVTGPYPARETWSLYVLPLMVQTAVGLVKSHVWYELENGKKPFFEVELADGSY